jgi:hypothetical protein
VCGGPQVAHEGGRGDLLGLFAGLGVRCTLSPLWTLTAGVRYTQQRGDPRPYFVLTYTRPVAPHTSLSVTASVLERHGDYEIDRMPEISLHWTPTAGTWALKPSLGVFVGAVSALGPRSQTTRAGATLDLTGAFRGGPRLAVSPALRVGSIAYGTGERHQFAIAQIRVTARPTASTEVGVHYVTQGGSGTSPLAFDGVAFERTVNGWLGVRVRPTGGIIASVLLNLATEPASVKEYSLSWAQYGDWTASLIYRATDGRMLVGFSGAR